jgi:seryl-tRNA synthetase
MGWKFLNIAKANAEVDRLNGELTKVTVERDEARTALESNSAEVTKHAEELQGQVNADTARIAELEASIKGKDAELAVVKAELQVAKDRIANPTSEVVKIAAHKAAEITGAQGQPPITSTPAGTPAGGAAAASAEDLMAQFNAIKDPTAQTIFYRKHAAAIMAASLAERAGK